MRRVQLQELPALHSSSKVVRLHLGSWSMRVPVDQPAEDRLLVPAVVFRRFPLWPGQTVGLWESSLPSNWHLGPLVGIIFDGSKKRRDSAMRIELKNQAALGALRAGVLPIFFSIWDLKARAGFVRADVPYEVHGANGSRLLWKRVESPLPDVLYNRGTYPDLRERRLARKKRNYLELVLDIPFINSVTMLGKWDTHRALKFFQNTRHLTPDTIMYRGPSSVDRFLRRHQRVFLKDDAGTWGEQILCIEAFTGSGYKLTGYLGGKSIKRIFPRRRALNRFIAAHCPAGQWILQQAVDRQTLNGRVFDFRIVMQKDDAGEWKIPHVLVNWAHPGEIVTNQRHSSDFLTDAEFAKEWGNRADEFQKMVETVRLAAHQMAFAIEAKFGTLGELGLDIGVDRNGHPWLFEANAKPFFFPGEGNHYPYLYSQGLALKSWKSRYSGYVVGLPPIPAKPAKRLLATGIHA